MDSIPIMILSPSKENWALLYERFEHSDLPLTFSDYMRPLNLDLFLKVINDKGLVLYVLKKDKEPSTTPHAFMGIYDLSIRNNSVNLLWLSMAKVGTELHSILVKACIDWLFNERGFRKVKIYLYRDDQSQKAWKDAGFKQEGIMEGEIFRKGNYSDVILLSGFKNGG